MCGEHYVQAPTRSERMGSSPHVRGTLNNRARATRVTGIIPACAGNTYVPSVPIGRCRDHPRMCGEHWNRWGTATSSLGSSPHVRGTLMMRPSSGVSAGIIPACAGNTVTKDTDAETYRDHPRMCGEHRRRIFSRRLARGSSPHVRGTHCRILSNIRRVGIIPACAGNTCGVSCGVVAYRDHPRMCGEHGWQSRTDSGTRGSSPHVRGAPFDYSTLQRTPRIIPACAGNTECFRFLACRLRDHPRMCGEHFSTRLTDGFPAGSSPHVRGTQVQAGRPASGGGIIPACAGNTERSLPPTNKA